MQRKTNLVIFLIKIYSETFERQKKETFLDQPRGWLAPEVGNLSKFFK